MIVIIRCFICNFTSRNIKKESFNCTWRISLRFTVSVAISWRSSLNLNSWESQIGAKTFLYANENKLLRCGNVSWAHRASLTRVLFYLFPICWRVWHLSRRHSSDFTGNPKRFIANVAKSSIARDNTNYCSVDRSKYRWNFSVIWSHYLTIFYTLST